MKLNGPVQTHRGEPVFEYYLTLLDPDSKEHQERLQGIGFDQQRFVEKVLRIVFLYSFVFLKISDPKYDPVQYFTQEIYPILRSDGNDDAKVDLLRKLKRELLKQKLVVEEIRLLLEEYITNSTTGPERQAYPVHLSLERAILTDDLDSMLFERKFFKDVLAEQGMEALKYLSINEANAGGDDLCTLPITIAFDPLYYFSANEPRREFTMEYDLDGIDALPVFFIPRDKAMQGDALDAKVYQRQKRIVFHYHEVIPFKADTPPVFFYRYTFLLLTYLCLKLLLASIPAEVLTQKKIFVPLVRLHAVPVVEKGEVSDEASTMRSLSKILAHMLAEECLSSSQGFSIADWDIQTGRVASPYKRFNGLSSLYSVLPKQFRAKNPLTANGGPSRLQKLAVIVVSHRKCDFNSKVKEHKANVYGEVIGIERRPDGSVRLETLTTFSANQDSGQLFRVPTAISDEVGKCYQQGYRHFLYVAKAPYTSTLHITQPDENEGLFFMSKDIIQALMQGRSDIHLYPLYCDKYYVVNLKKGVKTPSLYVDDVKDLTSLMNDPCQSSVVFFNLFNGITVGKRVYNGVISYATLVNVYDDITYDQYIRTNLLDGSQEGSLKREILELLTFLHFSRYEKDPGFKEAITFKLDPYRNIIGDDSTGSRSLFTHTISYVKFNALAFLTEVRGVLNREYVAPPQPTPVS